MSIFFCSCVFYQQDNTQFQGKMTKRSKILKSKLRILLVVFASQLKSLLHLPTILECRIFLYQRFYKSGKKLFQQCYKTQIEFLTNKC
jgi:hypothetical protein